MNSPLGKYSQIVAAGIAVSIIGAYLVAVLFGSVLLMPEESVNRLQILALIAVGAVFGSAATLNGVKAPIESAHTRLDKIETATGIPTHGVYVAPDPPIVTPLDQATIDKRIG